MDQLPKDVALIVHRYVYQYRYKKVKYEYEQKFKVHWSDSIQSFSPVYSCLRGNYRLSMYTNDHVFRFKSRTEIVKLSKNYWHAVLYSDKKVTSQS